MKKIALNAEKRTIFGRKVKSLRKKGLLPATIYGKKTQSVSVSLSKDEFAKVYGEAGETGIIEISLSGEKRPVLIHNVQKDPVLDMPIHVEFFQVDLKEKVQADVPIVQVGQAPAVEQKLGVLLTVLYEVEVEALPTDLPEKIEVDISSLKEEGNEIRVSGLKVPQGTTVLTGANLTVVKIAHLVTKEAEELAKAEAEAAEEAKGEGAGEVVAEGAVKEGVETKEAVKEEAKEEKKPGAGEGEKKAEKSQPAPQKQTTS